MHLATRHRLPSRVAARLVLLLALAAASLTLTHCRMVGDRLTGVEVSALRRADSCLRACKDTYKAAIKAEDRLNRQNRQACNGDASCLQAEAVRHAAAVAAIEQAYRDCKQQCHHQGGGGND